MSRYQRDPITGSIIPIAGYMAPDNVLNTTSEKPIQNQAVANPIEAMLNVYGSKNLLPNMATTQIVNGITFTVNSDGSVTASGSVTQGEDHATLNLFLAPTSIPAGFILTGCPTGGSDSTYRLDLTKATGTIVAIKDFGEGAVTTENLTYDYARIIIWEGAGNVNLTFYPMIRDPRIADGSYVPYAMSNRELTSNFQKVHSWIKWMDITDGGEHDLPSSFNELLIVFEVGNSGSIAGRGTIYIPYDFLESGLNGFDNTTWYRSASSNACASILVSKTKFRRGSTTVNGSSADDLRMVVYYR